MRRRRRQAFAVTFVEIDVNTRDPGVLTSNSQKLWREIEARDDCTKPRRRDRNDTRAAGDIEHTVTGLNAGVAHQTGGWRRGD